MIAFIPWRVGFKMFVSVKDNLGVVMLSIFGVKIICFQVEIVDTTINIIKHKGKERQIEIKSLDKSALIFHYFLLAVYRYIAIRELSLFVDFGKRADPKLTYLVCGGANSVLYSFYAGLFSTKGVARAYFGAEPEEEDKLAISSDITIMCAPVILLKSMLGAIKKVKRMVKVYER